MSRLRGQGGSRAGTLDVNRCRGAWMITPRGWLVSRVGVGYVDGVDGGVDQVTRLCRVVVGTFVYMVEMGGSVEVVQLDQPLQVVMVVIGQ